MLYGQKHIHLLNCALLSKLGWSVRGQLSRTTTRVHLFCVIIIRMSAPFASTKGKHARASRSINRIVEMCATQVRALMCEKRKIFFFRETTQLELLLLLQTQTLYSNYTRTDIQKQFYQRGDSVWPMNYWLLLLLLTMHTQQQKKKKRRRNNIPAQWNK